MNQGLFFFTPSGEPYFNMAMDEWIFGKIVAGNWKDKVVFRLYSWSEPAITIGYNQKADSSVDWGLIDPGIAVIRRITGGRAIYHEPNEFTFSLATEVALFPESNRSLSQANTLISRCIIEALEQIGIKADWARFSDMDSGRRSAAFSRACFNSVTKFEILAGGVKIAGGAQRRIGGCLIHQGSIKLFGVAEYTPISQRHMNGPLYLKNGDGLHYSHEFRRFGTYLVEAFSSKLGIPFMETSLDNNQLSEIGIFSGEISHKSLEKR